MLHFEHPAYLFTLLLIPVVYIALGYWQNARRALADKIATKRVFNSISLRKQDSFPQRRMIICIAITLLIFSAANLRKPGAKEMVKQQSADLFLALDISNSMLATDIAPNRLERTKNFIDKVIDQLKGERIGILVFAGSAYLSMPLTTDYNAAKMIINTSSPDIAGTQGTAIGDVIELATQAFINEKTKSKGLIIFTDGEDHDDQAVKMAAASADQGIVITTIGVGSAAGSLIPDEGGATGNNYKVDDNGQPIHSKLNEQLLVDIAAKSKGKYFNIQNEQQALSGIKDLVSHLDKGEFKSVETGSFISYYQWFLFPALLLLAVEWLWGIGFLPLQTTRRKG